MLLALYQENKCQQCFIGLHYTESNKKNRNYIAIMNSCKNI